LGGFDNVEGDVEVAGKSISAASRNDAECDIGPDQHTADGVDDAVSAHDEKPSNPFIHRPTGFCFAVFFRFAELNRQVGFG